MNHIALLIGLLILSGFFSGAEIALFSLSDAKLHATKRKASEKRRKRIEAVERIKARPNRLLVTILIGNNLVNVAASSMATVVALDLASQLNYGEQTAAIIAIVTGIMTFLILIFGEITPKALANKYDLRFSLFATPIVSLLEAILFPLVVPLSRFVNRITKEEEIQNALSEDELKAAIELSEKGGEIDHEEKELFEKILEFDEHTVGAIMTPRSKIFALNTDTKVPEALKKIVDQKFSRIPVYKESLDDIQGILTVHTLLEYWSKNGKAQTIGKLPLKELIKVPPTTKIHTLMQTFLAQKTSHMALIYDEHGGLIGLITLEDILEEVFGEIHDETDDASFQIKRIDRNTYVCNSDVELEHIEQFLQKRLKRKNIESFPWKLKDENKTLSYFLLEQFERFPEEGEKIVVKNREISFEFTVEKTKDGHIDSVRFSLL